MVGFAVRNPREARSEGVPQEIVAGLFEGREHLGDHLALEALGVHRHVGEAHDRQRLAAARLVPAIGRVEHDATDLRRTVLGGLQLQLLVFEADVELIAAALFGGDLEPVVGIPGPTVLCEDHARADRAAGVGVFEHEQVDAVTPVVDGAREGALRRRNALGEELGIRRQVHRVELPGEIEQGVCVARRDRPQD